jgi:hypothetical protein
MLKSDALGQDILAPNHHSAMQIIASERKEEEDCQRDSHSSHEKQVQWDANPGIQR